MLTRWAWIPLIFFGTSGCLAAKLQADTSREVGDLVEQRTGLRPDFGPGERAGLEDELLTVDAAVRLALQRNPALRAAYQRIGLSEAELRQAVLPPNPSLHGAVRYPQGGGESGTNPEAALMIDLVDLATLAPESKRAAHELAATRLQVAHDTIELAGKVRMAWYDLQAHEQMHGVLLQFAQAAQAAASLAERQRDAGNLSELEQTAEQLALEQARLEVAALELEIRQDRARLNRMMGLWGDWIDWRSPGVLPGVASDRVEMATLESVAVTNRLDLRASRHEAEAARIALRAAWMRWIPHIEAGVELEDELDGQRLFGPAIAIEIPLFDRNQASRASAKAMLRARELETEALAIDIRSEARAAADALIAARRRAVFYETKVLPLRAKLVSRTQLHYNYMLLSPYELLRIKQEELEARTHHIEALRDYWQARVELDLAAGNDVLARQGTR